MKSGVSTSSPRSGQTSATQSETGAAVGAAVPEGGELDVDREPENARFDAGDVDEAVAALGEAAGRAGELPVRAGADCDVERAGLVDADHEVLDAVLDERAGAGDDRPRVDHLVHRPVGEDPVELEVREPVGDQRRLADAGVVELAVGERDDTTRPRGGATRGTRRRRACRRRTAGCTPCRAGATSRGRSGSRAPPRPPPSDAASARSRRAPGRARRRRRPTRRRVARSTRPCGWGRSARRRRRRSTGSTASTGAARRAAAAACAGRPG